MVFKLGGSASEGVSKMFSGFRAVGNKLQAEVENKKIRESDDFQKWWNEQGRDQTRNYAAGQREDFAKSKGLSLEEYNQKERTLRLDRDDKLKAASDAKGKPAIESLFAKRAKEAEELYNKEVSGFNFNENKYALDQFNTFTSEKKEQDDTQKAMLQAEQMAFSPEGIKRRRKKNTILTGMQGDEQGFFTQGGALLGR